MQTVLLVSKMEAGNEVAVRKIHDGFAMDTLEQGIGIERLVAFIGSGYYAIELTVGNGDFQEGFHRFLAAAEVKELFSNLRPYVPDLPSPETETGHMPLATAMLLWNKDAERDMTTV